MSNFQLSRYLRAVVTVIVFTSCFAPPLRAADLGTSVIGSWKLTAVLDSSDISSMDDDGAKQLIGHILTIGRDKIQLDDHVCDAPDFKVVTAEANKYFRTEAHASANKLGLPNPVTAIHLNCTDVYIKSRHRLVVHWRGYFYDAVRVLDKSI